MNDAVGFDPAGAVAVVTGGASGIGLGIARALVRADTDVVIADLDADRAQSVAAELTAAGQGRRVVAVTCDVTSDADVAALAQLVRDEFGRIDIVVNNAGRLVRGLPQNIPLDHWQKIYDVNLFGAVRVLQAFVPQLLEQQRGYVVTTASMSGMLAYSYDRIPYSSSKAAVIAMTEALALYLPQHGIGVSCLCPGPVRTNIGTRQDVFEPDTLPPLQGLGHLPPLEPEVVGEQVVAAMRAGQYLVFTHPELAAAVRRRGASVDEAVAVERARLVGTDVDVPIDEARRRTIERITGMREIPDAPFGRLTGMVMHEVWNGSNLTKRERRLMTIAVLAASSRPDQLAIHVREALLSGDATAGDLEDASAQLAMYAGWPAGVAVQYALFAALEAGNAG